MSLCRVSEPDSTVYVYASVHGGYVCAAPGHRFQGDGEEMIDHLRDHQHEGAQVPPRVFRELENGGIGL